MGDGPPGFQRHSTCAVVLRIHRSIQAVVAYGTITPCGPSFQTVQLTAVSIIGVLQPQSMTGLGSSPFARRYSGNRFFFPLLRVLRCFSSPGLPLICYAFTHQQHLAMLGSPIRISSVRRLLTAPQSISVLVPSFIGSWYQGIHRAPFIT